MHVLEGADVHVEVHLPGAVNDDINAVEELGVDIVGETESRVAEV